ncbi:hypothetical protein PSN45_002904 [Yamadazyma tenuis]|nr:hypothetical protein PSN45_002904 [Yamadazyma tenuis]
MDFYQSNYQNNYLANPSQAAAAGAMGSMDGGFGTGFDISGSMGNGELSSGLLAAFGTSGYPNEPPLLEELGIKFQHIKAKTLAVLNPLNQNITSDIMADTDLAGPILFVLLFGMLLLLAGKVQFGYIYGVGLFGILTLHFLFKLMSDKVQIDLLRSASVIGYCLLPLVLISIVGVFFSLDNSFGYLLSGIAVTWCTYSASAFFVVVLRLHNVRALIAYPLALFYTVFALMAIFVEKEALSV